MFEFFNNDSQFLQWLSIYNMSSPVISLLLPILFLILPLILLKLQGVPISVLKYIEILKHLFARHSIGQLFNIGSVGWDKLIYIIVSTGFYVLQVYQNIVACYKFYKNMEKIHHQLFIIRDYVDITLQHMNQYNKSYKKIKTYKPFIAVMNKHALTLQCMKDELIKVEPNTFGITKFKQIGHVMKCFYQLYKNNESISALKYSFGFNGYLDNLCGLKENIKNLHIAEGKISFTKNKNKKSTINIKTTFVDAYFPTLINANPVKNSYSLDKHILITGPNAAGKTTLLKTTIFNIILSQQIGCGFYKSGCIEPYDSIHCYINIPDTSKRDSLFQAEARRCKDILTYINSEPTTTRHFCVFDELYSGTNPYEAIGSAYAFLKYLNKFDNVSFMLTTHYLDLCRRLDTEEKIMNIHMKISRANVEDNDFKYTYKMEKGISTIRGGVKVLIDLDYPKEIIDTTHSIIKELIL
jgi:DNA mismatch repair ATPase MutS